MVIYETKKAIDFKVLVGNNEYQLATGGIHSIDGPGEFFKKPDCMLIDADISSMYPTLMLNEKIKPEHLDNKFFDILRDLTERRLKAKREGDKVTTDALKITINSICGKLGFEHYWLFDEKALVSVTLNGQLFMLMLIEELVEADFEIISANTDGILTKVPITKHEEYKNICSEWEKKTNFTLEYNEYERYIRRDVNNYIAVDTDGNVKEKGVFLTNVDLKKGYNMPIVAIALKEYFVDGVAVEDTIRNHKDIYDFCKSQKVGGQFITELHTIDKDESGNPRLNKKLLQKNNRYFVSNSGGQLLKKKLSTGAYTNLVSGYNITLFNKYYEVDDYNINYNYYIGRTREIINKLNQQLSMFE